MDEGPATVTLTDDERALGRSGNSASSWSTVFTEGEVEQIVAGRVGALTADLAAAERVIANVRALVLDLNTDADYRVPKRYLGDRLRALLPAAPTEDGTIDTTP